MLGCATRRLETGSGQDPRCCQSQKVATPPMLESYIQCEQKSKLCHTALDTEACNESICDLPSIGSVVIHTRCQQYSARQIGKTQSYGLGNRLVDRGTRRALKLRHNCFPFAVIVSGSHGQSTILFNVVNAHKLL